jgi:hypothetical protein
MKKDFKALQKENDRIRNEIEKICDDFNMTDSRKDVWKFINALIENEIAQEEMCGE